MQSWLKLGAILALAQTISGANITIRATNPPANQYVTHCTVIIHDELFGCTGSSKPFPNACRRNVGVETRSICDTSSVTIDWYTAQLTFKSESGETANCTLSATETEGHCNTDNPNEFPLEANGAQSLLSSGSALWGLAPMAAGFLI